MGAFKYLKSDDNAFYGKGIWCSAPVTNYPEKNALLLPVSKPMRCKTADPDGSGKAIITVDCFADTALDSLTLVGHNISSSATLTVYGTDAATGFESTDFSQVMTWRRRTAFALFSATEIYRYWRIEIEDDANPNGWIQIGYLLGGQPTALGFTFAEDWEPQEHIVNVRAVTDGATPLVANITEFETLEVEFYRITDTDYQTLRSLFLDRYGSRDPFLIIPDVDEGEAFFGRFQDDDLEPQYEISKSRLSSGSEHRVTVSLTFAEDPRGIIVQDAMPVIKSGESLPSGATFSRASTAWYKNESLQLVEAAIDEVRNPHYFRHGSHGILLEPQRTNDFTYSEDLTNAAWTKVNLTISANAANEPKESPSTAMDKLVESSDGSDTQHRLTRSFTGATDNTFQSASFFAKAAERTWLLVQSQDKAGTIISTYVNLSDGSFGTNNFGDNIYVEPYANDTYRVLFAFDSTTGGGNPQIHLSLATSSGGQLYQGDGSSGLYIWGLQLEKDQPWPSSYIPTTTAAVTRSGDELDTAAFQMESVTVLVEYLETGFFGTTPVGADAPRIFNHGVDNLGFLAWKNSSGNLNLRLGDGSTAVTATRAFAPNAGDFVSILAVAYPDVSTQVTVDINGTSSTSSRSSAAPGFRSASQSLRLFRSDDSNEHSMAIVKKFAIYRGVQSLAFMRQL